MKSEWLKMATTKMMWIMLGLVVLLMIIGGVGFGALFQFATGDPGIIFNDPSIPPAVWTAGHQMARIPALIVGALAMSNEYRHKTLIDSYLAVPHRFIVVGAKALMVFLVGLVMGVLGNLAGYAVSIPFLTMNDAPLLLDEAETWKILAMSSLTMGLWALLGMGFGILVRNMIAAVLLGVGFAYILEPIATAVFMALTQFYPDAGIWTILHNLMPSAATMVSIGVTNPLAGSPADPFPQWGSVLVLLGWCVVPALLGAIFTVRRDV
ncbi:hypothetical protein [Enemella sp. A6]|uniref:hypothetical protein n=1 Tax=Enemella sp. A6 TaxID=3440152 RepID=UPI003EBE8F5F